MSPKPCWLALCPGPACGSSLAEPAAAASAEALGWWALQFTPRVCRHDEAVLLEAGGSVRLFGGERVLHRRIVAGAAELGWSRCAAAPTALGALALARCDRPGGWQAATAGLLDGLPLDSLREVSQHSGLPLVAAGDVHMHLRSRKPLQDVLTAIRRGCSVAQCGTALQPHGERHLRPRATLARLYGAELMAASVEVAARCHFRLDELKYEYPEEVVPPGQTPAGWLRHLTEQGACERYPAGVPEAVQRQTGKELALIAAKRYEQYFLTVHDIVRFARSRGILCQGRGSAANSAVCYCLHITEIDPARAKLLFERFISMERDEPPALLSAGRQAHLRAISRL